MKIKGSMEDVMLAKHLIIMHIKRHTTKPAEGAFSNIIEDKPEIRAAATVRAKTGNI